MDQNTNRRSFLKTSAAAGTMALAAPGIARAAGYPERNIEVYIPTREGGGRNEREKNRGKTTPDAS